MLRLINILHHLFCYSVEKTMMVDTWLDGVEQKADPEDLKMILVDNGIVRGT